MVRDRTDRRNRPLLRFIGAAALVAVLSAAGCTLENVEEEDLTESIESLLLRASSAWNDGDGDGVLETFAEASSTTVIIGSGPMLDRASVAERLVAEFNAGTSIPSLRFEEVEVRPLPPLIGIVTGRFVLTDDQLEPVSGRFTAVVRRLGSGWRIVHAHVS